MQVYPIGITKFDWTSFCNVVRQDVAPGRGIDKAKLDLKDPAAIIGSLDLKNDPLAAIREPRHRAKDMFHLLFICDTDMDALTELSYNSDIDIYNLTDWTYLSGSINEWVDAIQRFSNLEAQPDTRRLVSIIWLYLRQTRLGEALPLPKKHTDGTLLWPK